MRLTAVGDDGYRVSMLALVRIGHAASKHGKLAWLREAVHVPGHEGGHLHPGRESALIIVVEDIASGLR